MRFAKLAPVLVALVVLAGGGLAWWQQERPGPSVAISGVPAALGRTAGSAKVVVTSPSGRVKSLDLSAMQGGKTRPVPLPPVVLPAASPVTLDVTLDSQALGLAEGDVELDAKATDDVWRPSALPPATASAHFTVDLTPPVVEVLSTTPYLKHGGAGVVVYRATGATTSGAQVGTETFPGRSGLASDPNVYVALFTVPYKQDEVPPVVVASDAAGNTRKVDVKVTFLAATFGTDQIKLDDDFIKRKVVALDPQTPGDATPEDLLKRFLVINGTGRAANEATIRKEASQASEPKPLWSGPFRQQPNSQVFAAFPQERTYLHDGQQVDKQWHLGLDLASNKHCDVQASATGKVLFTGENGIYGNVVVLDHGLGLCTLYAHLADIGVAPGQSVAQGAVLGRSGDTGLAAGDHLHFGMLVSGVYTNPIEWFDAGWIHDRIGQPLTDAGISVPGVTDLPAPARGKGGAPAETRHGTVKGGSKTKASPATTAKKAPAHAKGVTPRHSSHAHHH